MGEPDYSVIIQSILDLLQADEEFAEKISEFRFGELPENTNANHYPACYVTTPPNPEVSRESFTPAALGGTPGQRIENEFWIVCVTQEAKTSDTQKVLYNLKSEIFRILESNTQLKKIASDTPLCNNLKLYSQGRFTKQRGKVVDGITIRVRTFHTKNAT